MNGDGIVDNDDLVEFSPLDHAGFIAGEYEELLADILFAILSGNRHELTRLSRQLLLASLGEHRFEELVSEDDGSYQNLLIHDFIVENDLIYAVGYDADTPEHDLRVFVLDATDFSAVSLVGEYVDESLGVNPQSAALDLLKVGDFLYVASQGNGLFVIDVADPAAPTAELVSPGSPFTSMVVADEATMYISWDEPSGAARRIHAVDIADPAHPQIMGSFGDDLTVLDMLYVEGMLYVYGGGITAFDASSPASPVLMDTVMFPGSSSTTISYRDGFVYAPITDTAAGLQGMTIVNARDPQNLQRIGDIAGIGFITEIDSHEQTLYATASTSSGTSYTLMAFEIGSDGTPELIDSRSSPMAFHLRYGNDRVYLASSLQLTAYDANALNKQIEPFNFIATDKSANRVEVVAGVAFVANDTELLAIDVSDPAGELSILDEVSVVHWINDLEVVGNYAYLANGTEGIKIAVRAGVASIEHGSFLDEEGARLMAERGSYLVPTMMAGEAVLRAADAGEMPPYIVVKARAAATAMKNATKLAVAAGTPIALGTDAGVGRHGENAHEFALMVEWGGLTPMQAIVAGTSSAAKLLGWESRLGTLQTGKLADIVAVPGDPLRDVSALEKVSFVMKGGVVFKGEGAVR